MTRTRRTQKRLERLKVSPVLPESLEMAFQAIERPAPKYADAPEARADAPRMTQDKR